MVPHEGKQDYDAQYPFGFVMTAISALDTASSHFFGACSDYATAPNDETLAEVNMTASLHTQAFRIAAIALNSDTSPAEHLKLLDALLLEQDAARVRAMNEALGAEVLEAIGPIVAEDDDDDEDDIFSLGNDEQIDKQVKIAYASNAVDCHAQMLSCDTQTFIDIVSEVA